MSPAAERIKKAEPRYEIVSRCLVGRYETEILHRYICNYEKIENKIYPIDEYEYAGEAERFVIYNLDLCFKLIENEDFNVEGWILATIYGNSMFVFINREGNRLLI